MPNEALNAAPNFRDCAMSVEFESIAGRGTQPPFRPVGFLLAKLSVLPALLHRRQLERGVGQRAGALEVEVALDVLLHHERGAAVEFFHAAGGAANVGDVLDSVFAGRVSQIEAEPKVRFASLTGPRCQNLRCSHRMIPRRKVPGVRKKNYSTDAVVRCLDARASPPSRRIPESETSVVRLMTPQQKGVRSC